MGADRIRPAPHPYCGLIDRLAAWCLQPDNSGWVAEAAQRFFLWEDRYESAQMEWLASIFAVWIAHDYRDRKGATAASRYLASNPAELAPQERQWLEQLHERLGRPGAAERDPGIDRFRLAAVQQCEAGRWLEVRDLHTGETFRLRDRITSRECTPGDALLIRLRRLEEPVLLLASRLSPRRQAALQEAVDARLQGAEPQDPAGQVGPLFQRDLPRLLHDMLDPHRLAPAPAPDPPPTVLVARAHFRLREPEALRRALGRHRSFVAAGQGGYQWLSGTLRKGPRAGQRVVLGQVLLEGERLVLETEGRARLRQGRAVLDRAAGGVLHHLLDEFSEHPAPPADPPEGEPEAPAQGPGDRADVELSDAVARHMRTHLQQWLDTPAPSLEGHTPREAARDPELRERVADMLRQLRLELADSGIPDWLLARMGEQLELDP